jgi:hypothetical protein
MARHLSARAPSLKNSISAIFRRAQKILSAKSGGKAAREMKNAGYNRSGAILENIVSIVVPKRESYDKIDAQSVAAEHCAGKAAALNRRDTSPNSWAVLPKGKP